MVICLIQVNAKSRRTYRLSAIVSLSVALVAVLLAIYQKSTRIFEYSRNDILKNLYDAEPVFTVSMFLSVVLVVIAAVLLIVVLDAIISQMEPSLRCSLGTYSTYPLLIVISFVLCLLTLTLSMREANEFDDKMKNLLVKKFTNYSSKFEDRRFVNKIQTEYLCCGVTSLSDFLDLSEIEGFETKIPPQTQLWSCTSWEYCSVPLSCCKSESCSQKVELLTSSVNLGDLLPEWFHQQGCIEAISRSVIYIPKLWLTAFLLIVCTLLHLAIMVLVQIVLTSYASLNHSKSLDSEESFAWLFDFGYPLAKDLLQADQEDEDVPSKRESDKQADLGEVEPQKLETEAGTTKNEQETKSKPDDGNKKEQLIVAAEPQRKSARSAKSKDNGEKVLGASKTSKDKDDDSGSEENDSEDDESKTSTGSKDGKSSDGKPGSKGKPKAGGKKDKKKDGKNKGKKQTKKKKKGKGSKSKGKGSKSKGGKKGAKGSKAQGKGNKKKSAPKKTKKTKKK